MKFKHKSHRDSHDLFEIARQAMTSRGLAPDFSASVLRELDEIVKPAQEMDEKFTDLTQLLWCSIDNDDSMDLDQITVAENLPDGRVKIRVGVADVDALVKSGTAIDHHAKTNTTSVYTGVQTFPMLPEKLSTNLTSLSERETRLAIVIEMVINPSGDIEDSSIYRALVRNQVKFAYRGVGQWLEGKGPLPGPANKVAGMAEQLRIQDLVAQKMRGLRYKRGALELETIEARAVMKSDRVVDMSHDTKNRAHELVEDFMIGANGVTAKYLTNSGYPALRRVVKSPERWTRIIQVASQYGVGLPNKPDGKALGEFLSHQKSVDALRFPDLSLTVVKLLGRGEYVLEMPGDDPIGHFGLAVRDYTHSTAPNRRFPDLITQRLIKSALKKMAPPYDTNEMKFLASHCTSQEDAADKVERQVRKSASALLLSSRIGEHFDALVTGASSKGTWARILAPAIEGKIVHGQDGLDVGDKVRLKLISTNVEHGFIDFVRAE